MVERAGDELFLEEIPLYLAIYRESTLAIDTSDARQDDLKAVAIFESTDTLTCV
ncbi:MAG: hypothetical protein FWD71_22930 [Oscillospiraceae bacterium]|nr:hypothetical protein [Oscillospiraceae bacterium]